LQSAEQRFYQAAEISRAIQYTAGLARALHNQAASVFYIEGKFTLALATMDEASQLKADSGGETWGLPFLQALIYQTIGDRKRARQALDAYLPWCGRERARPAVIITCGRGLRWMKKNLKKPKKNTT